MSLHVYWLPHARTHACMHARKKSSASLDLSNFLMMTFTCSHVMSLIEVNVTTLRQCICNSVDCH